MGLSNSVAEGVLVVISMVTSFFPGTPGIPTSTSQAKA